MFYNNKYYKIVTCFVYFYKIRTRKLYDNKIITLILKFNLALLCNYIPVFNKNNESILDREKDVLNFLLNLLLIQKIITIKKIDYKLKEKLQTKRETNKIKL